MHTISGVWHWLIERWPDLVVAIILAIIADLARVGSLLRSAIGHIKNKLAEHSVARLRKRIAELEFYRDTLKSYADRAAYLGALQAILIVLIQMCAAGSAFIADSLGFLNGGRAIAAFILAYTIGIGVATLRFYALNTDMKVKFGRIISRIDKDIESLREKLNSKLG